MLFSDDFPGAEEELFKPEEPVLQPLHLLHARVVYSFYQHVHFRLKVLPHRVGELNNQRKNSQYLLLGSVYTERESDFASKHLLFKYHTMPWPMPVFSTIIFPNTMSEHTLTSQQILKY